MSAACGISRASFATRWSLGEMGSELELSAIGPSNRSHDPAPPSLHGVLWGEFPRFPGTTRCSDSLPPFRPHFVAFAWPYRAGLARSLPGEGSPPAWVVGLVTRLPDRDAARRRSGLLGSWGAPRAHMLRSQTAPGRVGASPLAAPPCGLPASPRRRPPDRLTSRGSITRPARSLCTLRSAGCPNATQHSVPAAG